MKKHPQPARSGFLYTDRELYSKYAGFPAEKAEKKSVAKGGTTTSYQLPATSTYITIEVDISSCQ